MSEVKLNGTTPAIKTLLEIMTDKDAPTRKRIEAAEGLLAFEAPPEVQIEAKVCLVGIFDDKEVGISDRMDAVLLSRKFEARKVATRTVSARDEANRIEEWRSYKLFNRKTELIREGIWPLPAGWDSDLRSPDFVPPKGLPPQCDDMAASVRAGRTAAQRKAIAKRP